MLSQNTPESVFKKAQKKLNSRVHKVFSSKNQRLKSARDLFLQAASMYLSSENCKF